MFTMNAVMPLCLGWSGLVRHSAMPMSACWAIDVQTFCPLSTHSFFASSFSAFVDRLARSEPAPGSENSWQAITCPEYIAGRYVRLMCG